MTDIIRKAVELADDFEYHEDTDQYWGPSALRGLTQIYLDALAAQLVRQVDALDTPDTVEIVHNKVWVGYRSKASETWRLTKGPDRTMNTLRAIVDSGVLNDS